VCSVPVLFDILYRYSPRQQSGSASQVFRRLAQKVRRVAVDDGQSRFPRHGRGGQSALRFARLRMEKRHNYVRKVSELAVQMFITADRPNVSGLVLAGSADFKSELQTSDMFDQRLA